MGKLSTALLENGEQDRAALQRLQTGEIKFREAAEKNDDLQKRLTNLRQELSENRLELDRSRNSILHFAEQTENHKTGLEEDQREAEEVNAALEKISGENSGLEIEIQELGRKESSLKEIIEKQKETVGGIDNRLRAAEDALEKERSGLVTATSDITSIQTSIDQINHRVKVNGEDYERLKEDRTEFRRKLDEAKLLGVNKGSLLQKESDRLQRIKEEIERSTQSRDKSRAELEELQSEEQEIRNNLIAATERLHSLEELETSRSQYSEEVQEALKHFRQSPLKPVGTFADFVETNPEFERVVEEFLASELE